jgi:hypothetical protein
MRKVIRDGWRYERSDLLKCIALFVLLIVLVVAGALATALSWNGFSETERMFVVAVWAYTFGRWSVR